MDEEKKMVPPKQRCWQCDSYEQMGHNYCRMCGFHFLKGQGQHVKVAQAYHVNDKYCGNCGAPKKRCEC
jgi:ribosomal protein L37E